jgi:hypothetical protein
MANDEHVAMLKKGVDAWNAWYRTPYRGLRFFRPAGARTNVTAWAGLSRADLRKADLRKASLSELVGSFTRLTEQRKRLI